MRPTPLFLAVLVAAPLAAGAQEPPSTPPASAPDLQAAPPPPPPPAPPAALVAPVPEVAAPVAKAKHGIFPLWGDKVRAKGFELPEPFGFMVNYYYQRSEIEITNLRLGFNGPPNTYVGDLIKVPKATTQGSALAIRPSVMIFPFLSAYAVFSSGATKTNVHVSAFQDAIAFDTVSKSGAQVLALGATFQMGYKGWFGVADFNGSVADVERLADVVGANILSFRLGRNFRLDDKGRSVALWAGTAGQVIDVATEGTVRLAEVLPPVDPARIDQARNNCNNLPAAGGLQQKCLDLVNRIANPSGTVSYALDKRPTHVWNMVLGAQYALDRAWHFRVETTFLGGRTSLLVATEYRFDIL